MGALYLITGPDDKRYVGITTRTACDRFKKHVNAAKSGSSSRLHRAMRVHGAAAFSVRTLVVANDRDFLCALEARAIVAYNARAPRGYNLTAGGDGFVDLDVSIRQENSRKLKDAWADEASRNRRLAKARSPEARAKHRAAVVAFTGDPAYKARVSRRSKETLNRPDVKEGIRATTIAMHANPEFKARHSAAMTACMADPDRRARISSRMRANWADPVIRAKLLAARASARAAKDQKSQEQMT